MRDQESFHIVDLNAGQDIEDCDVGKVGVAQFLRFCERSFDCQALLELDGSGCTGGAKYVAGQPNSPDSKIAYASGGSGAQRVEMDVS